MNARPESAQAASDAQLPAEFRSALQLAQAAVWDWQLSVDRFQVDEAWLRAFGIDVAVDAMAIPGDDAVCPATVRIGLVT